MKRTLLITLEYPPQVGGVAYYYKHILEHLPADRVSVLDNSHDDLLWRSRFLWPRWLKGLWGSYRYCKTNGVEHILVGQLLPVGTIALCLRWLLGIPYTVLTHAMDVTLPFGPAGSSRKRWLAKCILRHANAVTTVSAYTKRQLHTLGVPSQKILMVYPCPHIDGTQTHTEISTIDFRYALSGKRILLSVGRLVQRKGFDVALRAFAIIAANHPDVMFVVVGNGPFRTGLVSLAESLGIQHRVIFTGQVTDGELAQWYKRCTAFVMPSRELSNRDVEGFGITFLEANSFGKPVIGGNSGGVTDAVIDGETGFLVDPEDIKMISTAMNRLLTHEHIAVQLGEQGRARVGEQFQWSVQASKIAALLEDAEKDSARSQH